MGDRSTAAISRVVFRGLLRWAREHREVPFSLRTSDLYAVVPSLRALDTVGAQDSRAVDALTRQAFRQCAGLTGPGASAAVDRGLEALRLLNSSYSAVIGEMRRTRADRSDRTGVGFHVGQVFMHRKFGYRGVVYGWDRRCLRDELWVQQMNANPDVPFYYVLPDENDCQRLFGGVRLTKYVGEDNMLPLEGVTVVHRAIDSYFGGYSPERARYIPLDKLQYEYPDDYSTNPESLRPAGEDANLLLHPEPGDFPDSGSPAVGGGGDSDSSGGVPGAPGKSIAREVA